MNLKWTKHLKDSDAKVAFKSELLASTAVLKRLHALLAEEMDIAQREQSADQAYASGSWAFLQADRNGRLRTLKDIQNLINVWDKKHD